MCMTCAASAAQTASSVSISSGPLIAVLPFLIGMRIWASQVGSGVRSTWVVGLIATLGLLGALLLSGAVTL